MTAAKLLENTILHTLSDKLSDELLQQLFPDNTPEDIRTVLLSIASEASPAAPPTKNPKGKTPQVTLYSDGASRGNPGEAGAGVQILDHTGIEIIGKSKYLGKKTNNEAEYAALIFGLGEAESLGALSIQIFLDSELIVRQICGQYKVKNQRLKPLYLEVMHRLERFDSFQISHVPREENKRADELANFGIDNKY